MTQYYYDIHNNRIHYKEDDGYQDIVTESVRGYISYYPMPSDYIEIKNPIHNIIIDDIVKHRKIYDAVYSDAEIKITLWFHVLSKPEIYLMSDKLQIINNDRYPVVSIRILYDEYTSDLLTHHLDSLI